MHEVEAYQVLCIIIAGSRSSSATHTQHQRLAREPNSSRSFFVLVGDASGESRRRALPII